MNIKGQRCVRFSEKNQIHNVQRLNPSDIWCTEEENSASQQALLSSMIEIQRERGNAYSHDLMSAYSDCVSLNDKPTCPKVVAGLARWSDRRGLEFLTIKPIRQERIQQRLRLRQTIIEFQRRLKQEGIKLEDDKNNMFARVAKTLTTPAEVFARTMGQADAISARQPDLASQANANFAAKHMLVNCQLSVHPAK